MANYTYEYANFPNSIMNRTVFKDVDDSMATIVNTIKSLQSDGKYDEAEALITANKAILQPYILSMEYLNFLDEETRNIEIFVSSMNVGAPKVQSVFYQTLEPSLAKGMDVWIA